MSIRLIAGDCRDVLLTLAAESVQCVVCSPPYYGLRDYGTALWDGGDVGCDHARQRGMGATTLRLDGREHLGVYDGEKATQIGTPFRDVCGRCGAVRVDRQIGLEATPDAYSATMVAVFREVRRVLRRDGTCWVNMGDSYAHGPSHDGSVFRNGRNDWRKFYEADKPRGREVSASTLSGAKPKDLLLMPARLALALRADGWWVRSDIIWHKPNPMPESVTDRPTSAYEHVFLLTRSARYYYDADAVREPQTDPGRSSNDAFGGGPRTPDGQQGFTYEGKQRQYNPLGRSCRNVWTIATHAYPDAHFATFPPELAERCIKAGTSERGCCVVCGKPWVRVTQASGGILGKSWGNHADDAVKGNAGVWVGQPTAEPYQRTTTGWSPGCRCGTTETRPCVVLDPFIGAGTTALVADRLQRDCIGVDLNVDYTRMAMERCRRDAPLLTSFPPAEDPEDERMGDLFAGMAAD